MESKTLNTIQVLMKIGRILSKIAFIACIVGASLALVGLLSVAVGQKEILKLGGVSVYLLAFGDAGVSTGTMYAATSLAFIFCLCEVFMAAAANSYFKLELAAGTPFTLEVASKMHRVGAAIVLLSIGCLVLAQISYTIINGNFSDVADMHVEGYTSIGVGFAFIVCSLLCKLGAEQRSL